MGDLQAQIEEIIACPICYQLPRRLPVSSCSFGHIVCQDCQPAITFCPLCRNTMMFATNSLVGNICIIADHKCKYTSLGCDVKLKLNEILIHEEQCLQRTLECPFRKILTGVLIIPSMKYYLNLTFEHHFGYFEVKKIKNDLE